MTYSFQTSFSQLMHSQGRSLLHWLLMMGLILLTLSATGGGIRYVKPTASGSGDGSNWSNASGDLQAMVNASSTGDQVWVAAGVYKPTSTTARDISFAMKNGVAIYGGFAGIEAALSDRPTINPVTGSPSSSTLSGDIGTPGNNADNSYHVIYNPASLSLTNSAVLDGFVITGGNAFDLGGGVYNNGSESGNMCSPQFVNCLFQSNQATNWGGALVNDGSNSGTSNPMLTNCSFKLNSSGVGAGAIYNYGFKGSSSSVLTNCLFESNTTTINGGAILNNGQSGNCNSVLTNCLFLNNTAGTASVGGLGGAIENNGISGSYNVTLANCAFINNRAETGRGGAIINYENASIKTHLTLTNCSFLNNTATIIGGAIYSFSDGTKAAAGSELINCILFNNGGKNTFGNFQAVGPLITYSLLDNTTGADVTGPGNLTTTTSPFVSTTSVALNACNPAINAGNPASTTATVGTTDLLGNPRFYNNGQVDMGAVEYQGNPASLQAGASLPQANLGVVVSLTATGTTTYQWTAPPTAPLTTPANSSAVSVSLTTAGVQTFTVVGTTAQCSLTALVSLTALAGPDLSAILSLPDANFPVDGSKNLLMQLQEVNGSPATGNITITITVPTGYTVSFDNSLTNINVSGRSDNPVAIQNSKWHVSNSIANQQLSLSINGGESVGANSSLSVGFSITRTKANSGSVSNITVNVADDSSGSYDVNRLNNVYARIITGL